MYVTRPLSLYRKSPSSLSLAPPEGPSSGILVIQDEEAAESRWCCGLFKMKERVNEMPFPQNKILRLTHAADAGEYQYSDSVYAVLIPVLNQPLSSNQYYIINSRGSRTGYVPPVLEFFSRITYDMSWNSSCPFFYVCSFLKKENSLSTKVLNW